MHSQYKKALKLRLAGKSYREIAKRLNVSKSSCSIWFKDLKLPPPAQELLKEKGRTAKKQLLNFNKRRTKAIINENQSIRQKALNEVNPLSKNRLKLIGAALYWAEGYKFKKQKATPHICFSNSDPYMIALFLRFLREIIKIPEKKLRLVVHIYPSTDKKAAVNFWARVTNVPQDQFRIIRQISRASQRKRPFNSLPHGTLKLIISGRQRCFQIQGWINALKQQSGWK